MAAETATTRDRSFLTDRRTLEVWKREESEKHRRQMEAKETERMQFLESTWRRHEQRREKEVNDLKTTLRDQTQKAMSSHLSPSPLQALTRLDGQMCAQRYRGAGEKSGGAAREPHSSKKGSGETACGETSRNGWRYHTTSGDLVFLRHVADGVLHRKILNISWRWKEKRQRKLLRRWPSYDSN